ncbi:hypothetical protein [Catenulispora rubra]|uniref:hypothetical protein n=1 Tax=Catenulispora rubra TaxID=280293 RepID=UPI001892537F|nr:hypothetical protein [Catenulispora rubra]
MSVGSRLPVRTGIPKILGQVASESRRSLHILGCSADPYEIGLPLVYVPPAYGVVPDIRHDSLCDLVFPAAGDSSRPRAAKPASLAVGYALSSGQAELK